MKFFRLPREWRQPPVLDGQGIRPTTPRPSPEATKVTYVVRRRSDRDEEMRALKARISELERDVAEGLDAALHLVLNAFDAAEGVVNPSTLEVCEQIGRAGDIVKRLKAKQP